MSISMREMLEAGVHFGHQTRFWNPKMAPYIYGHRNKIHIVNLEKTLGLYQDAMKYLKQLSANRGTVLFVGTKRQAREIMAEEAQRAGMPYVDSRWLGGMLTNFNTVRKSVKKMQSIDKMLNDGSAESLTKKERLMMSRERDKLEKALGGIRDMGGTPETKPTVAEIIADTREKTYVRPLRQRGLSANPTDAEMVRWWASHYRN